MFSPGPLRRQCQDGVKRTGISLEEISVKEKEMGPRKSGSKNHDARLSLSEEEGSLGGFFLKGHTGCRKVWKAIRSLKAKSAIRGFPCLPETGLPTPVPTTVSGQPRAATGHTVWEGTQRQN